MERMTRLELAMIPRKSCAFPGAPPQIEKRWRQRGADRKEKSTGLNRCFEYGADDEARTRYLHLGKVALYQMSYIRIPWCLRAESNHRHGDFQSPALPTELQRQMATRKKAVASFACNGLSPDADQHAAGMLPLRSFSSPFRVSSERT